MIKEDKFDINKALGDIWKNFGEIDKETNQFHDRLGKFFTWQFDEGNYNFKKVIKTLGKSIKAVWNIMEKMNKETEELKKQVKKLQEEKKK